LGIDAPTTYRFALSRGTQGTTMYCTHHIIKSKRVRRQKMKLQGTRDSVSKLRTEMGKPETKSVLFVRIMAAFSPVPHRRMCSAAVITPLDSHRLGLGYLSVIPFSSSASDVVAGARIDDIRKRRRRQQLRRCHHLFCICCPRRHEPHQSAPWHTIIQRQWRQVLFCFLVFVSGFAQCDVVPPSSSGTDHRLVVVVVHALIIHVPRRAVRPQRVEGVSF